MIVALFAPGAGAAVLSAIVRGVALSARASAMRAAAAALIEAELVGSVARSSPRSTHTATCAVAASSRLAGVTGPVGVRFCRIQSTARSAGVASGISVTSAMGPGLFWLRNLVVSMQYATTGTPSSVRLIVPAAPPGPWVPLGRKYARSVRSMSGVGPSA